MVLAHDFRCFWGPGKIPWQGIAFQKKAMKIQTLMLMRPRGLQATYQQESDSMILVNLVRYSTCTVGVYIYICAYYVYGYMCVYEHSHLYAYIPTYIYIYT